MGHAFWAKTTKQIADKWNIDFPNSKRKTRAFLPVNHIPKMETTELPSPEKQVKTAAKGITGS